MFPLRDGTTAGTIFLRNSASLGAPARHDDSLGEAGTRYRRGRIDWVAVPVGVVSGGAFSKPLWQGGNNGTGDACPHAKRGSAHTIFDLP